MTPIFVSFIAFVAVASMTLIVGRILLQQAYIQRRLPAPVLAKEMTSESPSTNRVSFLTRAITEKIGGGDSALRTKLRRELIRAGYFSDDFINYYILGKIAIVILLPILAYTFSEIFIGRFGYLNLLLIVAATFLGIAGPEAFIARCQRHLQYQYRIVFPDLLDMLVVCVDAGLSLDASFARAQPEVAKRSSALGKNLAILGSETRAGKTTADALDRFADRINLDEIRAFVLAIRQSIELGTDISDALRVFSDEMRDRRILRAEETANKLSVKMVIPLGLCIFPVILLSIMLPVVIRLLSFMGKSG
jgi:tight adherence protein C